jgi:hypothetical protein
VKSLSSIGAALLALGSLFVPALGMFAAVASLLAWLNLAEGRFRWHWQLTLMGTAALSVVGIARFASTNAMSGIVEAQHKDSEADTVARLREIVFAQDTARQRALLDTDKNGIGSALTLRELTGEAELPNGSQVTLLGKRFTRFVQVDSGVAAAIDDYLFRLCLPGGHVDAKSDRWTDARHGGANERLGETRWIAVAWPAEASGKPRPVFSIDAYERILVAREGGPYIGERAPVCDPERWQNSMRFRPWRGKKPRKKLPGNPL